MKRLLLAASLAAIAAAWYGMLPPRARQLPAMAPPLVRGAFHVHTNRSDGTGTVAEVAAAAARAGLRFVVLTDHGDATRPPDLPAYRDGVLIIDAVEISTDGGHIVAVGMPASPYPLGGEARDVIEDVARLGGLAVAAHPGSAKPELRWVEWTAPFGGLEWLNADSEWRDESAWSLVAVLLTYPGRKAEVLASLLDKPEPVLGRWDALTRRRRVVALAATDAHARIGLRSLGEPYDNTPPVPVPAYEQMFRALSNVVPGLSLTGDAAADAKTVVDAIRAGHVYSAIEAIAAPAVMSFTAMTPAATVSGGDVIPLAGPVVLHVDLPGAADARIELLKDGQRIATNDGPALRHITSEAGVYRVEAYLPGAPGSPPVPWIVSNPIYVGRHLVDEPVAVPRGKPADVALQYGNGPATQWRIEKSADAQAALDVVRAVGGTELALRYGLGGVASAAPYAAAVMEAGPGLAGYDRLLFTARGDQPMRMSVQLRAPGGQQGERWQRSVFLDRTPREVAVYFDELTPVGTTNRRRPDLAAVDSVLFVVDTTNTRLGDGGQIWIDDVRYAR